MKKLLILTVIFNFMFFSCKNDDDDQSPEPTTIRFEASVEGEFPAIIVKVYKDLDLIHEYQSEFGFPDYEYETEFSTEGQLQFMARGQNAHTTSIKIYRDGELVNECFFEEPVTNYSSCFYYIDF